MKIIISVRFCMKKIEVIKKKWTKKYVSNLIYLRMTKIRRRKKNVKSITYHFSYHMLPPHTLIIVCDT